ncbi:putative uncharacterized protein [Parachlamydia acanthamoebae UV-7]|uniref:Uncharacterized protein n=1 Tax=Parachlamydia acanthamoebae (strain UV7) TaxID=765952 RepID=F8KZL5_PARAV|nr:hypothetical protein [Parachlamydia acanthamoebae]CCB86356.1 putative uncharacterized protein [Parachlamydia acanthamoebae UV-7]
MPTIKPTDNAYPHFLAHKTSSQKKRDSLKGVEGNGTSSLINPSFKGIWPKKDVKELKTVANVRKYFESPIPAIQQHFHKRISLIFLQAVVCYGTNLKFREGHTIHQGFNAEGMFGISFQAAHSATLPCLYAKEGKGKETIFLYRSGYYDESNATIDLEKAINDADRAIDEKYRESLLRNHSINLLNSASKRELTPEKVVRYFLPAMQEVIEDVLSREKDAAVKGVLEFYRDEGASLAHYVFQQENIDLWLNLNLEGIPEQEKKSLRPHLYELRYQMIQADQKAQSMINSKIEDTFKFLKKGTKTRFFESFFFHGLFEKCDDSMRIMLSKLLNISNFHLDQATREVKVNMAIHNSLKEQAISISKLSKKVHKAINSPMKEREERIEKLKTRIEALTEDQSEIFNILFYKRLYEQAHAEEDKDLINKLLKIKETKVDEGINKNTRSVAAEKYLSDYEELFEEVIEVAIKEIEELKNETKKFQRKLFKALRKAFKMKNESFIDRYKTKNPNLKMDNEILKDLDSGEMEFSRRMIQRISGVFGINKTLFYPSHFAEIYE